MTDKSVLEFKTADVISRIRGIIALRNLSGQEVADFVNEQTGKHLKPSDVTNIMSGRQKGQAAEEVIQVLRTMTGA